MWPKEITLNIGRNTLPEDVYCGIVDSGWGVAWPLVSVQLGDSWGVCETGVAHESFSVEDGAVEGDAPNTYLCGDFLLPALRHSRCALGIGPCNRPPLAELTSSPLLPRSDLPGFSAPGHFPIHMTRNHQ